jgi:RES domain-containing protein
MEVFRLSNKAYAKSLSGIGAALKGARWNSIGIEIIYTAANRSLAMAEVAVHFSVATAPPDYKMVTIYIPDDISMKTISIKDLPSDWAVFPHSDSTKMFGDKFIADNKYCVLKIPSAVTKGDFNYLMNPRHPEFSRIKIIDIEDFRFDSRLLK